MQRDLLYFVDVARTMVTGRLMIIENNRGKPRCINSDNKHYCLKLQCDSRFHNVLIESESFFVYFLTNIKEPY